MGMPSRSLPFVFQRREHSKFRVPTTGPNPAAVVKLQHFMIILVNQSLHWSAVRYEPWIDLQSDV